jgi:hypothetical protein
MSNTYDLTIKTYITGHPSCLGYATYRLGVEAESEEEAKDIALSIADPEGASHPTVACTEDLKEQER